jgi:hypothetical protein
LRPLFRKSSGAVTAGIITEILCVSFCDTLAHVLLYTAPRGRTPLGRSYKSFRSEWL